MSTTHEVRKHLRPQPRDETIHSPQRRRLIVAHAAVGVVGIVASAVVAVVLGLTRPGYSFVAEPVVALMSGPNARMQDINFVVLGVSVVAAAIGLHLAVRPSRWGALGPALLAFSGLGPVLAGVTAPVPVHFVVTFLGAGIGLIVLSTHPTGGDPGAVGVISLSSPVRSIGVALDWDNLTVVRRTRDRPRRAAGSPLARSPSGEVRAWAKFIADPDR